MSGAEYSVGGYYLPLLTKGVPSPKQIPQLDLVLHKNEVGLRG